MLVGAILFTIGTLARQVIPVYLGATSLFIGYLVAANYWNDIAESAAVGAGRPARDQRAAGDDALLDGGGADTRLVGFPTMLVWNRALWLAIAAAVLAVLHRRFRFAHADGVGRRALGGEPSSTRRPEGRWQGTVPRVSGVFGPRTRVRQTLAVARSRSRR